jgi:hypothetical protein
MSQPLTRRERECLKALKALLAATRPLLPQDRRARRRDPAAQAWDEVARFVAGIEARHEVEGT